MLCILFIHPQFILFYFVYIRKDLKLNRWVGAAALANKINIMAHPKGSCDWFLYIHVYNIVCEILSVHEYIYNLD